MTRTSECFKACDHICVKWYEFALNYKTNIIFYLKI